MHADRNGPSFLERDRQVLRYSIKGGRINNGRMLMAFITAIGRRNPSKFRLEFMVCR
jgi:hypothetical protein